MMPTQRDWLPPPLSTYHLERFSCSYSFSLRAVVYLSTCFFDFLMCMPTFGRFYYCNKACDLRHNSLERYKLLWILSNGGIKFVEVYISYFRSTGTPPPGFVSGHMIAGKLPVHREANITQLQAQKQIRPHGQAPFKWPARSRSKLSFINMDRHG
jgi:hypothetical protein